MSHATTTANPYGCEGHKVNGQIHPAVGNRHQWVATAVYTVAEQLVDAMIARWAAGLSAQDVGIELDHENLASVVGPICLRCHQHLTPAVHARPCPVVVVPVLGMVAR